VGTLRAADPGDYVVSTYREHVHALVRGIPPGAVMAELFGRATGCSGGYGGSMHLFDAERRFLGGYAIVGETFPVAIGAAYFIRMNGRPDAVLCYFGDGAANQGCSSNARPTATGAKDPLRRFREQALEAGWLDAGEMETLDARAQEAVDEAVAFAERSPPPTDLYKDVYVRPLDLYGGGR